MARCPHCDQNHADGADYCPRTGRPIVDVATRMIGRTIAGKYRLIRSIGQGGMGTIFEAEHHVIKHKVALKLLHEPFAISREPVQRLYREARATGAIGHPNIIKVYDVSETEEGVPFLVMELLEGRSLGQIIEAEGAQRLGFVLDIGIQMMSALEAAHKAGVIHRDLKSDNVFISKLENGHLNAKLLDFGISKIETTDQDSLRLTQTGAVLGTPYYMAPEQAAGRKDLDHRIDIYASGVILYEMLVGSVPHRATNYNALLMEIIARDVQPFACKRNDVPENLEQAVLKALRRDRRERWSDARAMREKLVAIRDGLERQLLETTPKVASELKQAGPVYPTLDAAIGFGEGTETPLSFEAMRLTDLARHQRFEGARRSKRWKQALPMIGLFSLVATLVALGMMLLVGVGKDEDLAAGSPLDAVVRSVNDNTWPSRGLEPASSARRDPDYVRIRVLRTPAFARASINGRLIPEHGLDVKRAGQAVVIVVRADGYETVELQVKPTEDRELTVSLPLQSQVSRSTADKAPAPKVDTRVEPSATKSKAPAKAKPPSEPALAIDRPMDNPF
ncbi:MAG: serine/threonine protein kinase [Myxococcota bacterium]|nr:serine/threonine protein kinase [Myxococcota bacterium]